MNFNLVPNINQTTTVQALADQLKIHTKLQSFFNVGQIDGQPMLRIATNVNQMLLIRRMAWKFNRVNLGNNNPAVNPHFIISQQGFQDLKHAGATCFTLINSTTPGGQLPAGGAGVDLNPGVYQNGNAKVVYGTFNGGNEYGPQGNWQTAGVIFNPTNGQITVQFLDPHPFQTGNIGTTIFLMQGIVNPAFNSQFVYNQLTQLSGWVNGYSLVSIPDNFHIVLQGNGGQQNTLSSISASGGITTIVLGSPNPIQSFAFLSSFGGQYPPANVSGAGLRPGGIMTFSGIGTNTGLNGTTVTLLTATATEVTFATPTGVTIIPGSDTGNIYAAPSGAPGIWNLGWVEAASVFDINNPSFPLPTTPIEASHRIAPEYTSTGDNTSISCEIDYGNGVVKFRLSQPVSTYPFAYAVVYQARAPKFINGQSVFQWPDDLSWVVFEMCLWQGMRFAYGATAAETQTQMQVAALALQSALESEDREANDMALTPEWQIMR